jgi:hypothetical protein
MSNENKELELPAQWRKVQSAIWLVGLAIIAWQGWWWPGILVLVAISGLVQAGISLYLKQQTTQQTVVEQRERHLPTLCPNCGGPIDAAKVKWTGPLTASCPYCGTIIKALETSTANSPQEKMS